MQSFRKGYHLIVKSLANNSGRITDALTITP